MPRSSDRRALVAAILLLGLAAPARAAERVGLAHDGEVRSYLLFVPAGPPHPRPLVLAFHGAGFNAGGFADETKLHEEAALRDAAVVYPEGTGSDPEKRTWNAGFCCGEALRRGIDDVGFARALVADVAARTGIDRHRVSATGMSNGAMLAYRIAAEAPDLVAAIAPVAGAIGGTNRDGEYFHIATPDLPVPVMIVHGRRDPFVLFDGGVSAVRGLSKRRNLAVADATNFWTAADRCSGPPSRDVIDPARLVRSAWTACAEGDAIVLWELVDLAHVWPEEAVFPAPDGAGTQTVAATILDFLLHYRRD